MLSVSLCSLFFACERRAWGACVSRLPFVAKQQLASFENRVGYMRIPGSIFFAISAILIWMLTHHRLN